MKKLILSLFLVFSLYSISLAQPMPFPGPVAVPAAGGACTANVAIQGEFAVVQSTNNPYDAAATWVSSTDANTMIIAAVMYDGASVTGVSCTFDGTAMTQAGTPSDNGTIHASLWYQMNPTAGVSKYLVCTATGTFTEWYIGVKVFTDVNSTTPIRTGTYQTSTTQNPSITITSNVGDYTMTAIEDTGSAPSSNQTYVNNAGGVNAGGMDRATTPAATVTHTWAGNGNWAFAGASVMCK